MLGALITSKTRIKLLVKFFLNPGVISYLRELAKELNENTNAIRTELNRLTDAGYLISFQSGNKVYYGANTKHPLFESVRKIVSNHMGIDKLFSMIIEYLGNLKSIYVIGDYADGIDAGIIEVIIVGEVNKSYLENLISRVEKELPRKISCRILSEIEAIQFFANYKGNALPLYTD